MIKRRFNVKVFGLRLKHVIFKGFGVFNIEIQGFLLLKAKVTWSNETMCTMNISQNENAADKSNTA